MEKTKQIQFTESQNAEIAAVLNTLETFAKKELTKLKREYPYLLTKTSYGYSLNFYKIKLNKNKIVVSTQADQELGVFSTLQQAVIYTLLTCKNQVLLANKLASLSNDYIMNSTEVTIYEKKLHDFSKKKTKDWWQYDLYHGKLSEAKNKMNMSKLRLADSISDAKYIIKNIKGSLR